ncbi:MAG: Ig-like domain-containing protein [Thermoanaerobaculia bacterium]|nr:Ig-like domain-containing protein [Thermoanaerobaculia bacterium]
MAPFFWAVILALTVLLTGSPASSQNLTQGLGNASLQISGSRLAVSPEAQTVPFQTPTLVETRLEGHDTSLGTLPPDLRVVADFSGPEIDGILELETVPNEPFRIPRLRIRGEYLLDNIRLVQGDELLAYAEPRASTILVTKVLVTQVSSHALTQDEIRSYGLVIQDDSYQALNLTFGFGVHGRIVEYNLPVVYRVYGPGTSWGEPASTIRLPDLSGTTSSQRFRPPGLIPFKVEVEQESAVVEIPRGGCDPREKCRQSVPPAPPMVGVILFPADINLLHQFFSVVLTVQNGAPENDPLTIRDLTARISVPSGLRQAETEPPTPLGVPVPIRVPGPDGRIGTADDLTILVGQSAGEAEFLLEGLEQGTHVVDFEIEGLLDGLPTGLQTITGRASGAVVVRDPTLSSTITHPEVVRAYEEYSLFLMLSNLGNTPANDILFKLPPSRLAGVELAPGEEAEKNVGSLLPGESTVVEFRMVPLLTGRVVASSAKAGSGVRPEFEFGVRVASSNPLSPESIVLPKASEALPTELLKELHGLVGLGHSLAEAPATLVVGRPQVDRQTVNDRIYRLAQAGRHLELGEELFDSLAVLLTEWNGARDQAWEWDRLRRQSQRGLAGSQIIGDLLSLAEPNPIFAFERFAATTHFLAPQAVLARGANLILQSQTSGKVAAGWGDDAVRELPFADLLPLGDAAMALLTVPEEGGYRAVLTSDSAASPDVQILLPAASPGQDPRRVRWDNISIAAGGRAWVDFSPGEPNLTLEVDDDGDGVAERSVPGAEQAVARRPFEVIAAVQRAEVDDSGHVVDVLFSTDIDLVSMVPRDPDRFVVAGKVSNGGMTPTEQNVGGGVLGQPEVTNPLQGMRNPRIVRVVFNNPLSPLTGPHVMTVSDLVSVVGESLSAQDVSVELTVSDQAIQVVGQVIDPYGNPLPYAEVNLVERDLAGIGHAASCVEHVTAAELADAEGRFSFDYVRQGACGGSFKVKARDPAEPRFGHAEGRVRVVGETKELNVVMVGRGILKGNVTYEDGTVPEGLQVFAHNPVFQISRRAWTDDSGNFRMAEVPVGTVTLMAFDNLGNRTFKAVEVPAAGAEVVQDLLILKRPDAAVASLRGTISDLATGQPEPDAYVALYVDGSQVDVQRTDAQGAYDFGVVPAGVAQIEAFDGFTGLRGAQLFFDLAPDETRVIDLQLRDDRGVIEGHVRRILEDGTVVPVADAIVYVAQTPFNTTTDSAGYYRLDDIFSGHRDVVAADPSTGQVTQVSVSVDSSGLVQRADLYFEDEFVPEGGISGVVLDYDGTPVAGARVHLAQGYWSRSWAYEETTDSEGRFFIGGVSPGAFGVHAIRGSDGGIGFGEIRFPGDSDSVTVRFQRGVIRGRTFIEDDDGHRTGVVSQITYRHVEVISEWDIVGVMRNFRTLTTEADGSFEIPALHGPYQIFVRNSFHGSQRAEGFLDDLPVDLDFKFEENGEIRGIVYDVDGVTPVAGAELVLKGGQFEDYRIYSGEHGEFSFELVPAGRYEITITYDAGTLFRTRRVYARLRHAGDLLDIDLVLPNQGSIEGRVESSTGEPVPGAVVTLKERGFPFRRLTHNADELGNYRFDNIFAGEIILEAQAPLLGGLGGKLSVELSEEGEVLSTLITLEGSGELEAQVLRPDTGGPVVNARVRLHRDGHGIIDTINTDGDGRFHIGLLPLGRYRAHIFDPTTGRRGRGEWLEITDDQQVVSQEIVLEVRGIVDGHLYSLPENSGVPGETITLRSRGLKWFTVYSSSDIDGYYEFLGIPEGEFELRAKVERRRASATGTIVEEDQRVTRDLYLERLGRITGTVRSAQRVDGTGGDVVQGVNVSATVSGSGLVDASLDNPFTLDGILAGRSGWLRAEEINGERKVLQWFRLPEGEDADFDLTLKAIGALEVTVLDSMGAPAPGVDVQVINQADFRNDDRGSTYDGTQRIVLEANTGDDHLVRFNGVREGRLRASTTHPVTGLRGSASSSLSLDGETVQMTLQLQPSALVQGRVFMPDGTSPAAGAIVSLDAAERDWQSVQADEQGYFAFEHIPLGSYILVATESDGPGRYELHDSLDIDGELDDHVIVLDAEEPYVVSIDPPLGSRDLPIDTAVVVTFSEPMRPCGSQCGSWARIRKVGGGVSPALSHTWSAGGTVLTLQPIHGLASGTAYRVEIRTDFEDLARNNLDWQVTSSFYTADVIPPAVIDVTPGDGAVQVEMSSPIEITFSETIDPDSLSGAFQLTDLTAGQPLTTTTLISFGDRRVTLTPVADMEPDRLMELRVQGVVDTAGNVQEGTFVATFWTLDQTDPTIQWLMPSSGEIFTAGETIEVSAAVTDNRALELVRFQLGEWSQTLDQAPFTWQVPAPIASSAGPVEILAEAYDIFGNSTTSTLTIWVEPLDNAQPPSAAILCPAPGDFIAPGLELPLTFEAADDLAIESYWLEVDGEVMDRVDLVNQSDVAAALHWTPSADSLPGDVFLASVHVRDFAGNVQTLERSLSVPEGRLLIGDQAVSGDAGPTFLGGGRFDLQASEVFGGLTLLHGADLVAANPADPSSPFDLDVLGELRVQCNAQAQLADLDAADVVIESRGRIMPLQKLALDVTADRLEIETEAQVDGRGRGYLGQKSRVAAGAEAPAWIEFAKSREGGAHGGLGTWKNPDRTRAEVFGSLYLPTVAGGGAGGNASTGFARGGNGGGIVRLDVGSLVLHGEIQSDGDVSVDGANRNASPGAGGSVLVFAQSVEGVGAIRADGGSDCRGGGGGGRVALWVDDFLGFDPDSQVWARGGERSCEDESGGAGSVFVHTAGSTFGNLRIDNGNPSRASMETVFPELGTRAVTSTQVQGADLRLTTAQTFHPRWWGTTVRLHSAGGDDLGSFAVRVVDGDTLLLENAAAAASATSMHGFYRFDRLTITGGAQIQGSDVVAAAEMSIDGQGRVGLPLDVAQLEIGADSLLTLLEPLDAAQLTIRAGTQLMPEAGEALVLRASDTLTLEAGAVLSTTGLGYGPGGVGNANRGKAPTGVTPASAGQGGCHGGYGNRHSVSGQCEVYGSVYSPQFGGGGSGSQSTNEGGFTLGGAGGGSILIEAGELILDGLLEADGEAGEGDKYGGAGGTIRIIAERLRGAGSVRANGAEAVRASGGGGRIAYHTEDATFDFAGQSQAIGGGFGGGDGHASAGTVYWRTATSTYGELWIDNLGRASIKTELPVLGERAITAVEVDGADLLVSAAEPFLGRWVQAWAVLTDGSGTDLGTFEVGNFEGEQASASIRLLGAASAGQAQTIRGLYRFDRVTVTGGSRLEGTDTIETADLVFDADGGLGVPLDTDRLEIAAGSVLTLVDRLSARDLVIRDGATVTSIVGQPVDLEVPGTLTLEAGALITVNGLGYAPGTVGDQHGEAPDGVDPAPPVHGGSHGGHGVHYDTSSFGEAFDSVYWPVLAGGGAGSARSSGGGFTAGGRGGGVVLIEAGELVLDGRIEADGDAGSKGAYSGGGGTVRIRADRLSGVGTLQANGGVAGRGAGGGGRVSFWISEPTHFDFAQQARAYGGSITFTTGYGGAGSVFWHVPSSVYGTLWLDNGADPDTGAARTGAPVALPSLEPPALVSAVAEGGHLRLVLAETLLNRWHRSWVVLEDADGLELGTHRVLELTDDGALVEGAAAHAAAVASLRGVYLFDDIMLGQGVDFDNGSSAEDLTFNGNTTIEGDVAANRLTVLADASLTVTGSLDANRVVLGDRSTLVIDALGQASSLELGSYVTLRVHGTPEAALSISGDMTSLDHLTLEVDRLTVGGAATFGVDSILRVDAITAGALALGDRGSWTPRAGGALTADVVGAMTVGFEAVLDVTSLGYTIGDSTADYGAAPEGIGPAHFYGGSHGGGGSIGWATGGHQGEVYGSVFLPIEGGASGGSFNEAPGAGGGVMRLDAGSLSLEGQLLSRGGGLTDNGYGSAGAGGSILLTAGQLSGSGVIDASGGTATNVGSCSRAMGGGGGGRVALLVDDPSAFDAASQIRVEGGGLFCSTTLEHYAAAGTLLIKSAGSIYGELRIQGGHEEDGSERRFLATELPVLGTGTVTSVESQGADAWLDDQGRELHPRWVGAVVELLDQDGQSLSSHRVLELDDAGRLLLEGAAGWVATSYRGSYRFDAVDLVGSVGLVSSDPVQVTGATRYDGVDVRVDYGVVSSTDVVLSAGTRVHSVDSGRIELDLTGTLEIEPGAVLDVSAEGYSGSPRSGDAYSGGSPEGLQPSKRAGGSHGGVGSHSGSAVEGDVYGSVFYPLWPGSGGGKQTQRYQGGGDGGGVLDIRAAAVVLEGEIRADGDDGETDYRASGGAGGSILIEALSLSGAGLIRAAGGNQTDLNNCGYGNGAGGGGRVALWVDSLGSFDVEAQVETHGGLLTCADGPIRHGGAGTLYIRSAAHVLGEVLVDASGLPGVEVWPTPFPRLGWGTLGSVEVDAIEPAHAWVEPADAGAIFGVGVSGMWARVEDVDYRVLGQSQDRRWLLLEGAAGVVAAGDRYRGIYKLDSLAVRGGAHVTIGDFTAIGVSVVDERSELTVADQEPPMIDAVYPADGSTYISGQPVEISALVSDNVAPTWVRFNFNGQSEVDSAAPFGWNTPAPAVVERTSFILTVEVFDAENNSSSWSQTVWIEPTSTVLGVNEIRLPLNQSEAEEASIEAFFYDPAGAEPYTATIDWGDGQSAVGTVSSSGSSGAVIGSHTYVQDGDYTVEVCVTNAASEMGCRIEVHTVANAAPVLKQVDYHRWTPETWSVGNLGVADWDLFPDESGVVQLNYSRGTTMYSDFPIKNHRLKAKVNGRGWSPHYIGFGLGFQPGDATNDDSDYLLMLWQQRNVGTNVTGLNLVRITGEALISALDQQPEIEILTQGIHFGSIGWPWRTEIDFEIEFDAEGVKIWVDGQLEIDQRGDFPDGRLSYFAHAQRHVDYYGLELTTLADVGRPARLHSTFTDVGIYDTFLSATVDWGDGSPVEAATLDTVAQRVTAEGHLYAIEGEYTARLCVTDSDGGEGCLDLPVEVRNAVPDVIPATGLEILTESLTMMDLATFADTGFGETHTATVDWGDGSAVEPATVTDLGSGQGEVSAAHSYAAEGTYSARVCVTDSGGAEACRDVEIHVVSTLASAMPWASPWASPWLQYPAAMAPAGPLPAPPRARVAALARETRVQAAPRALEPSAAARQLRTDRPPRPGEVDWPPPISRAAASQVHGGPQ